MTGPEPDLKVLTARLQGVDRALAEMMARPEEWREIGLAHLAGEAVVALWGLAARLDTMSKKIERRVRRREKSAKSSAPERPLATKPGMT